MCMKSFNSTFTYETLKCVLWVIKYLKNYSVKKSLRKFYTRGNNSIYMKVIFSLKYIKIAQKSDYFFDLIFRPPN